jgi:Leucine-rich repeat (LRR) protein
MRNTYERAQKHESSRCSSGRAVGFCTTAVAAIVSMMSVAHAAIPDSERAVLTTLYVSTQGSHWLVSTNWNGPPGTECSWYGITCDSAQAHVVGVQLISNALTGPLPALDGLTELRLFDVHTDWSDLTPGHVNQVSGSIPPLSGLHHLQAFSVASNEITGPLPDLAGLTELREFDVQANALTGSIPMLTGLASLESFDVSNTLIGGIIPPLRALTRLQVFRAENTPLTGSVPDLSGLADLRNFDVSNSTLDGSIGSLSGLTSLEQFDASWCRLTGPIPSFHDSANLTTLDLSHNRLSGAIPAFPVAHNLFYVDLSFNQLSSSIPSLAGLVNLELLFLNDNRLTGTIPSLLGLSQLLTIDLHNNALSGPIPALSGQGLLQLQTFDATGNQLTGPIPSLSGLSTLIEFAVGDNRLSGHIPGLAGLGLTNLQAFSVDHNALTGSIPDFPDDVPYLSYFNVSGNQLTGSIPSLRSVPRMADFRASNNRLTGSIPDLAALTFLARFDVGFNRLTGSLPATASSGQLGAAPLSTLCPNQLTHSPSDLWDEAVGYSPWYRACAEQYVNLDQFGLTGSWYNVDEPGKGILFDVMPDRVGPGAGVMFGGWFNYLCSPDTACPVNAEEPVQLLQWFSIQGEMDASQPYATLGIYESRGGNFDAPPVVGATPVGIVSVAFEDCTNGILNYHFADGRYPDSAIPLTRLTSNTACTTDGNASPAPSNALLSGAWYDPQTGGQGMLFDVSPAQNAFFAAWYTYAADGSQDDPREGQRWYTLQTTFAPGATAFNDVTIYESTGGAFDGPAGVQTVPIGSANLSFQSCTAMTVEYTFTAGENAGRTATRHLVRLSSAPDGCGI